MSSRSQAKRQFSAAVGVLPWHLRSFVQSRRKRTSRGTRRGLLICASYDDALLERYHQQFTPHKDSKFYHARTGMQKDARTAETL